MSQQASTLLALLVAVAMVTSAAALPWPFASEPHSVPGRVKFAPVDAEVAQAIKEQHATRIARNEAEPLATAALPADRQVCDSQKQACCNTGSLDDTGCPQVPLDVCALTPSGGECCGYRAADDSACYCPNNSTTPDAIRCYANLPQFCGCASCQCVGGLIPPQSVCDDVAGLGGECCLYEPDTGYQCTCPPLEFPNKTVCDLTDEIDRICTCRNGAARVAPFLATAAAVMLVSALVL